MILVLHPGALGDLILALPALAALRSHFTGAHITIAGNQDYLRVIARGYADELLSLSVLPLHAFSRQILCHRMTFGSGGRTTK